MAEVVKKYNITNIAELESRIGVVKLFAKEGEKESEDSKTKSTQHIQFESITTASGNKLSMSVADFRKSADTICYAREQFVSKLLKAQKYAPGFIGLKLQEGETLELAIQNTMSNIVEFLDKNKPESTSGPTLRVVEDYLAKLSGDFMLVAAGTTGNLPSDEEILEAFQKSLKEARVKALGKVQELGTDALGQFRLTKPKGKAAKNTENTTSESNTEESNTEEDGE